MSRYRFYYDTYFRDDSGYAVVSHPHAPITVITSSKDEAKDEVFRVFKGAEYKHGWSLRASLEKVEAIDDYEPAPQLTTK